MSSAIGLPDRKAPRVNSEGVFYLILIG